MSTLKKKDPPGGGSKTCQLEERTTGQAGRNNPTPDLSSTVSRQDERTTGEPWGATPDDWFHFDLILGLTADLLPVVSNPNAEKSAESKIQGPGKTPSDYNTKGLMRGFANWTSHQATPADIAKWSAQPDYGVCLQMREARAIDVDVDDPREAAAIEQLINERLAVKLPVRRRDNANKFLMLFLMPGDFKKRRFSTKTDKGAIEFLATGQQAVMVGTHPSGSRYVWPEGLPNEIPELTEGEFFALWSALHERFGSTPSTEGKSGKPLSKPRTAADISDPMVDYLYDEGHVLSESSEGKIFIRCPNEAEHTTDSGETATAYFPAGVGGYEQGHFACLHSHCQHLTDHDFKAKIGYLDRDMPVVDYTPKPEAEKEAEQQLAPVDLDTLFDDLTLNDEDVSKMADAEFLVDNLIVRGSLHAFVAPANGGKTTLFIHLCEQLAAKGLKIFYVNADANPADLKRQHMHAKEHRYTVLAPDAKAGKSPKDIIERFQLLNKTGADLRDAVIILDTLKKFSNMIDKKQVRAFLTLMRGLSAKGATVCLLSHTNKYPGDDGKLIFEGTGDLRTDVDNLIYLESAKDDAAQRQEITTWPDKVRANYQPVSYWIDLANNRKVTASKSAITILTDDQRRIRDLAITALQSAKQLNQSVLVDHISQSVHCGPKKIRENLHALSYGPDRAFDAVRGEHNAWLYSLRGSQISVDDMDDLSDH